MQHDNTTHLNYLFSIGYPKLPTNNFVSYILSCNCLIKVLPCDTSHLEDIKYSTSIKLSIYIYIHTHIYKNFQYLFNQLITCAFALKVKLFNIIFFHSFIYFLFKCKI